MTQAPQAQISFRGIDAHPFWNHESFHQCKLSAISPDKGETPANIDLQRAGFSTLPAKNPYFSAAKLLHNIGESQNQQLFGVAHEPLCSLQDPDTKHSLTVAPRDSIWVIARANPKIQIWELYGLPVANREYLLDQWAASGLDIVALKDDGLAFRKQVDVTRWDPETKKNKTTTHSYDCTRTLVAIPTIQYARVRGGEVHLQLPHMEGQQHMSQFPAEVLSVSVSITRRALNNIKGHFEPDEYLVNLPVKIPAADVKDAVLNGIMARWATENKKRMDSGQAAEDPGLIWDPNWQIDVWSTRHKETGNTIHYLRGSTRAALDAARLVVHDGINILGRRVVFGTAKVAADKANINFAMFDQQLTDKRAMIYIDDMTPDTALMKHFIDRALQQTGAVATITASRSTYVRPRGDIGRSAFVVFTTKTAHRLFMDMATQNGGYMNVGLGRAATVKGARAAGEDPDEQSERGGSIVPPLAEPEERMYISVANVKKLGDNYTEADMRALDEDLPRRRRT